MTKKPKNGKKPKTRKTRKKTKKDMEHSFGTSTQRVLDMSKSNITCFTPK